MQIEKCELEPGESFPQPTCNPEGGTMYGALMGPESERDRGANRKFTIGNIMASNNNIPDLTQRPLAVRMRGGWIRDSAALLDKGRARLPARMRVSLRLPLDQRFLDFVGVDPERSRRSWRRGRRWRNSGLIEKNANTSERSSNICLV